VNLVGEVDDKMIELSWEVPANDSGDIEGYVIEISEDGINFRELDRTELLTYSATGLQNAQKYWFRVSAYTETIKGAFKQIGPLIPMVPATDTTGALIIQEPGGFNVVIGGQEKELKREDKNGSVVFSLDNLMMDLSTADTSGEPLPTIEGILLLEVNGIAKVKGEGFKKKTAVGVWLIQNTGSNNRRGDWMRLANSGTGSVYFLGFSDVDDSGNFSSSMDIPEDITPGRYTLQATGITKAGSSMSLSVGAILMRDLEEDSDGDRVPDVYEFIQNTDPNDPKSFLDSNRDGVPDYVSDRSPIENINSETLNLNWGVEINLSDLPTEVQVLNGRGELVTVKVKWDLNSVNVFKSGSQELKGEYELPKGMFNGFNLKPSC
jgi:hypothetical protein